MPHVRFTPNLKRHLDCAPRAVMASTVAEALAAVFAQHAALRGYILDDQGGLRRHVAIFVDGELIADRTRLSDPLNVDSEVFIAQALSGG